MKRQITVLLISLFSVGLFSQFAKEDLRFIENAFLEVEDLCLYDNGQMWGIDLNFPCMVVDGNF